MAVDVEELVKLAEQLDPAQQDFLIYRLRLKQMERTPNNPTRETLLREVAILRQTPPKPEDSLLGKYAGKEDTMSEEEFHHQMHSIATEWEQELDELSDDES